MGQSARLADDVVVVRGGRTPFQKSLRDGCEIHPQSGLYGFSVQSAPGRAIQELARECPHRHVGHTTVGEIRKFGYDVVATTGGGYHATVFVPPDWTEDDARQLANLFQGARNESSRRPQ